MEIAAQGGATIIFMVAFVGCGLWSTLLLTFTAHYVLVTIVDSGAGHDEIHFPSEGILDWWWKPLYFLWLLGFWILLLGALSLPLLAISVPTYAITLLSLLWFLYPVSVFSTLYTQNWLMFLHPTILGRMLRHYVALAYVHLVTLIAVALGGVLLFATIRQSLIWMLPVALVLPAVVMFYARNWGRFAWLSLNYAPRVKKPQPAPASAKRSEHLPVMEVQEIDETSEGIREGLPSASAHSIRAGVPATHDGIVAGRPTPPTGFEQEDEWAVDTSPYMIVGDPDRPNFEESKPAPVEPQTVPVKPTPPAEPVDEWAIDETPYDFTEAAPTMEPQSEANRPITNTEYFDKRAKRELAALVKAKRQAEENFMPEPSKRTPGFHSAMIAGVWEFMTDGRTLGVLVNLVLLTVVELFFLTLVVQFWPKVE